MSKISREIAVSELVDFVKKHKKKEAKKGKITIEYVEEQYPSVIEAIENGLLSFPNGNAVYELFEPVKDTDGNIVLKEIKFRSRVKTYEMIEMMDGLDMAKNQGSYTFKILALASQQPIAMLKKLEDEDFEVMTQLTAVFQ